MNVHSVAGTTSEASGSRKVLTRALDAAHPIHHIETSEEVDRLCCEVKYDGAALGILELPVFDGFVSQYVLEDAIAAEFAWEILGEYLRRTLYPLFAVTQEGGGCAWSRNGCVLPTEAQNFDDPSFHNAVGWTIFLQEVWDRPSFPVEKFYAPVEERQSDAPQDSSFSLVVEVSEEIPDRPILAGQIEIAVTVGGATLGVFATPVPAEGMTADAIMSAITCWGGFELCRVAVREALVGKPINGPSLRGRLSETALRFRAFSDPNAPRYDRDLLPIGKHAVTKSPRLGSPGIFISRYRGPLGSSVSRRAHLPTDFLQEVLDSCNANRVPIVRAGDSANMPSSLVYAPDLVSTTTIQQWPPSLKAAEPPSVDAEFGRAYWEGLFARTPDPWNYGIRYEQEKYEQTLSLVPDGIASALELASAEGFFTEKLAPRVKHLISSDVSQIAVDRAAQRCAVYSNVEYRRIDFVQDELPTGFDLIICSEVLYYVGGLAVLQDVAAKIEKALNPGGYFLTAHANQVIDDPQHPGFDWGVPFGARRIGGVFASTHLLKLVKELRTPLYRIQLFRKGEHEADTPEIIETDLSFPLPPHIAHMALWNGANHPVPVDSTYSETKRLPILTYHRVAPGGSTSLARFRVTPQDFELQIRYLKEAGYYTSTFDDWRVAAECKKPLPGRAVLITFDDGYADFTQYAWPVLKQFGLTAVVFLVSGQLGGSNVWDSSEEELRLMSAEQVRDLQNQGVIFGSHALSHRSLPTLTSAEIALEHFRSRCTLETALGRPVQAVSYPYGDNDAVVRHLAGACGYLYGVTTRQSACRFTDSLLSLPRIEINGDDNLERFIAKLTHAD